MINKWANFLFNEKFDPKNLDPDDVMELIYLCEEMAKERGPIIKSHKDKLISRRFVCDKAIELGIDLAGMKHKIKRKYIIGRGLLDVWLVAYKEKYGSTVGTNADWESKRRNIKTKLAKQHENIN